MRKIRKKREIILSNESDCKHDCAQDPSDKNEINAIFRS
jgi:hypothetical protein